MRGLTYRTIFALLYGLGLRVGEVARLRLGDVDWERQLLVIRLTKFSKSRLVPFGPTDRRPLAPVPGSAGGSDWDLSRPMPPCSPSAGVAD